MGDFAALDATGNKQEFSTTQDANGYQVGSTCITDPVTGAKEQVGTQYQTDNNGLNGNAGFVSNVPMLFNGITYDRQRGNADANASLITISGMTVGNANSGTLINHNHRGCVIGINVSQIGGSTNLTIAVYGVDAVSGQTYLILETSTISTVSFNTLTIYPGAPATSNASANFPLPRSFEIVATVTGSGAVTATIGASMIV